MAGEKTEAPTPRKREQARQKGQVARSREVGSVAILFGGLLVLSHISANLVGQLRGVARQAFLQVGTREASPESLLAMAGSMLQVGVMAVAPLTLAMMLVGLGVNFLQVGPLLSLHPLKPDLSRIDPLRGARRFFSTRSLMELMNSIVKVAVTGFVASQVVRERFWTLAGLQAAAPEAALGQMGGLIQELATKCGLAMLVMAAADFVYQRRSYEGNLKMSRQELKDEVRQSEGDPHLKGRLRQMARQMAAHRMMQQVPNADVVITNPIHLAVALQYTQSLMRVPVVVAKGQLLVAEQIKQIAREHGVPVVENAPLAQALYRSVDLGMAIPPELYQAVAEVLAFVYRLQGRAQGVQG